MQIKKLSALLLSLIITLSIFSGFAALAADDEEKGERQVYLHAFDTPPSLDSAANRRTVYIGDTANIYLAVDNPNKGDFENDTHIEPQFDMQGYTVKIYFDTNYFEFVDPAKPMDFSIPNQNSQIVDGEDVKDHPEDAGASMPGYMTHNPSYSDDIAHKEGYAAATVFLMGSGFFPNKTATNQDKWYDLCKLALRPKQPGSTSVRLEYDMGTKDDLELFAKNVTDEKLNFEAEVKNGGIFYLTIEEAGRPSAPLATVASGTYHDEVSVELYHENADPCEIYYTTDPDTDPRSDAGTNSKIFTYLPGDILQYTVNTTLKAAVYRAADQKWSDVVTFTYDFLPRAPYVFNDRYEEISNIYSETWDSESAGYYVYACDNKNYAMGITEGNSIYYTFDADLSPEFVAGQNNAYVGDNPDTQWVRVVDTEQGERTQRIEKLITKSETVRLVTKNKWGISDVAVYHLGIKPSPVTASPDSGVDAQQPVTLSCATTGATIYYTTNGSDPRKDTKAEYTAPLYLEEDTVIKAVSYYEGEWSAVSSFWYVFTDKNKSGVSAVYPSGIYTGSVEVILYPDEPGQQIEVLFEGSDTWVPYDGTIVGDTTTVDAHIEFNARIVSLDNTPEDKGDRFVYIIKPLPPAFSPEGCEFTAADVVTVFSPESTNENRDRFELWYTTDGTTPTSSQKAPENDVINIPISGYTEIKAVVVKDGEYMSEVVTHTYNVVYDRPAKPIATLPTGYYTREIGSDEFTVSFITSPKEAIYYTIGKMGTPFDGPDITTEGGATLYDGNPIPVRNGDMIKAIAVRTVNGKALKSDVATYWYEITPQAPTAAASAVVTDLPLVPVDALAVEKESDQRAMVAYTVTCGADSEPVRFSTDEVGSDGHVRFYIDTKTGNAYKDAAMQEMLYNTGRSEAFTGSVILEIKAGLDGAESETTAYAYILGDATTALTAPFADKESGTYTESKEPFVVHFYSVYTGNDDITIEWKYDGDADWQDYDPENPPTFDTKDKIIYARTTDGAGNESPSVGYIYTFDPPVPEVTPVSGIYHASDGKKAYIAQSNALKAEEISNYEVYYRVSTDPTWYSVRGANPINPYTIDETITIMAYTYNRVTKRVSDTVYRTYIVAPENALGSSVTINPPFHKERISAHLLGKGEFAAGIQFTPDSNVYYTYSYSLTPEAGGGDPYTSDAILFDKKAAFVPTERIDSMTVTAWINGDKLNTLYTHDIDFVHLEIPVTDLPNSTEYTKNTPYHVLNTYKTDPTILVYYTTDNTSSPTIASEGRKCFTLAESGPEEKLTQTTTVKTVYFSACGTCDACREGTYAACGQGVYGAVGEYTYAVPKTINVGGGTGSGGGGTQTIDKTRKYTSDIFGNEHPTHIGYINGYPDGSVRPEGDITREEITAILYRITNHAYEKPFVATGDTFPDVEASRWSAHDIEYMADKAIIEGYPDGEFKPARNLTRAEFAALIFRFVELKATGMQNPFEDLEDTHWASASILALAESGLMQGYEDGTFRPENNITRAEVMTVVNKILGRKPLESYVKSLHFNPYNDLAENKWYYVTVLEATITHNYWLNEAGYEYKWEDWK